MWLNPLFDAHSNFTSQSNASRDDKCCEVEVDIDGSTKREYFVQILQYRPLNGPPGLANLIFRRNPFTIKH